MDSLELQLHGYFDEGGVSQRGASIAPRPFLAIGVGEPPEMATVDFLIDTGADLTTICPADAVRIWGARYLAIDFEQDDTSEPVRGIGGSQLLIIRRKTRLTLFPSTERVRELHLERELSILPPNSPSWINQSLLGRDLLSLFEFVMSQKRNVIELTLSVDDAEAVS